jgi:hypothetical protein
MLGVKLKDHKGRMTENKHTTKTVLQLGVGGATSVIYGHV